MQTLKVTLKFQLHICFCTLEKAASCKNSPLNKNAHTLPHKNGLILAELHLPSHMKNNFCIHQSCFTEQFLVAILMHTIEVMPESLYSISAFSEGHFPTFILYFNQIKSICRSNGSDKSLVKHKAFDLIIKSF